MSKLDRTNAARLAEGAGVAFELLSYEVDEDLSATHVAQVLGMDPDRIFKTIVLVGERSGAFVCVIPGSCEIDLKKAAAACGAKSAFLLPLKELEGLTGYVRGGCSPIGMKKPLPTFLDETALLFERICVSAGKRGLQMILTPTDLLQLSNGSLADLI